MPIRRKHIEDQLAGLKNTQAKEVSVRSDIIEAVLGEDIANYLAVQKTTLAYSKPKSAKLETSIRAMNVKESPTQSLGKYNRLELLEAMEEMIEEKGGLDSMFPAEQQKSTLQLIRDEVSSSPQESVVVQQPSYYSEEEDD